MIPVLYLGQDSLSVHNTMPFSNRDREQDPHSSQCAATYKGAWCFSDSPDSSLNGLYQHGQHETVADGVIWETDRGYYYSYKQTEMKFHPA